MVVIIILMIYYYLLLSCRPSNAVAPMSNNFNLERMKNGGTNYRNRERMARENKRRRIKRNQVVPSDVNNHLRPQRYVKM